MSPPPAAAAPQAPARREQLARWAWLACFAVAALLRSAWLDYDLPWTPETDAFKFVDEAQRMAHTGSWRPGDLQYPTGYTYLLAIADLAFDLRTTYATHLAARVVSAVFGLGTLLVIARFCSRTSGPWAGLIAGSLVAFSPLHVTMSRSAAPDAMLTFWLILGICTLLYPNPNLLRQLCAGACLGIATGTKFTALYGVAWLPVFAASAWPAGTSLRTRSLGAATALAAAGVALLAVDPWIVSLAPDYLERFRGELLLQAAGQVGYVQLGPLDYLVSLTAAPGQPWLSSSLRGDLGPAAALPVAGCVWGLATRRERWPRLLTLFTLGYLFAISSPGHIKALRFVLPVLPALAVMSAGCIAACWQRWPAARMRWLLSAVLILALSVPLLGSADTVTRMAQPSSVARLRVYAAQHLPPGTTVFVEPFALGDYRPLRWRGVELTDVGSRQYGLSPELGPSPERNPLLHGALPEQLRDAGVQYLVLHSYFEDGFAATADNLRWFPRSVEHYQHFVAGVQRLASCVHREPGYASGAMGPEISVWRMHASRP